MASALASYSVVVSLRPPSCSKAKLSDHCLLFKSSIPPSGSSVVAEWKQKREVSYICRNSIQGDVLEKGSTTRNDSDGVGFLSIHHVGILCENLERSLDFYQNLLGLEINEDRPEDKLPYRGAWLWVGSEMIHLMELPNPDPTTGRPEHGGRDRHACLSIRDVSQLKEIFDKAGNSRRLQMVPLSKFYVSNFEEHISENWTNSLMQSALLLSFHFLLVPEQIDDI